MNSPGGLLIDLDGTVYLGRELLPGTLKAVSCLRERGVPHLFSTNTSRKSRANVVSSLAAMGLEVSLSEVYTAPVATTEWLASQALKRVHLLLSRSTWDDFEDFEITDRAPDAVVVGDMGPGFTFEVLNGAFASLLGGARLVAVHKNRFWLPEQGPTLDAGPFVAALEFAAETQAVLTGKPSPAFFHAAARRLNIRPDELAVVGDDLTSDILGGNGVGMTTLLVRTGKFDPARLERADAESKPHHVADDLDAAVRLLWG
ncbi:MAG: TIGR01458 family HAD-type hydrolase [Gemmatimonadota bacterium]